MEETYQEIKSGIVSGKDPPPLTSSSTFPPPSSCYFLAAASLPHIRVWYDGNVYVSENNRRLFVFKRLESEVVDTPARARASLTQRVAGGAANRASANRARESADEDVRV